MGLRERIEHQIRQALRQAEAQGGSHINISTRVNRVIVRNVGNGGHASATAEQTAPIVQEPPATDPSRDDDEGHSD
jgi:hypothetical protein